MKLLLSAVNGQEDKMDYGNCGIVSCFCDFTIGEFEAKKIYMLSESNERLLVPMATKAAAMHR
jgi:hypothetical protein